MMRKRMMYVAGIAALTVIGVLVWNVTARAGYESAEYKVIETDGKLRDPRIPRPDARIDDHSN